MGRIGIEGWVAVAFGAAAPHVGLPDLGPPGAPGPFAFADGNRLEQTLQAAGLRHITVEAITSTVRMGNDVDDVTDFITSLPESRRLFDDQPADKVAAAIAAPQGWPRPLHPSRRPSGRRVGVAGDSPPLIARQHLRIPARLVTYEAIDDVTGGRWNHEIDAPIHRWFRTGKGDIGDSHAFATFPAEMGDDRLVDAEGAAIAVDSAEAARHEILLNIVTRSVIAGRGRNEIAEC